MIDVVFGSRKRVLAVAAVVVAAIAVGWAAEVYPAAELNGPLFGVGTLAIGVVGLVAVYAAIRLRTAFSQARSLWRELAQFEAALAQAKQETQALRYDLDLTNADKGRLRYDLDRTNAEKDALRDRIALAERRLAKLAIKMEAGDDLKGG